MSKPRSSAEILSEMNARSREVFRRVVEGYLGSGAPVGSRTLTREMNEKISAATVRNVMQDLEFLGLLDAPHISAGRVPTNLGLRLFVDSLMEVAKIDEADRTKLDQTLGSNERDVGAMLEAVGGALSGLTHGASLVLTPKHEAALKHLDFVSLSPERALVVLVFADGHVENRLFTPPRGLTPSALRQAANYLNAMADGMTVAQLIARFRAELARNRREIDTIAADLVEQGLAVWENKGEAQERLIVRGRANLLDDAAQAADIDRVRTLFEDLERKRDIAEFLELTDQGEGVRIFIGAENRLFSLTGSTLVVSPYMNAERKIVGAVGVIGPTRLNYGRIVPIVDYTAQLVGRILSERSLDRPGD